MENNSLIVSGNIVDVVNTRIFKGKIHIENGIIISITEEPVNEEQYIIPGLIDAHIHIESSMLLPTEFAKLAVVHGTVASVSDPHEIANVLGVDGVNFMINNGRKSPFHFYFGAPSCVPATPFETSGATIGVKETEELLDSSEIKYLSEMMNFPGVLFNNEEVMAKISAAKKRGKKIDGHAPGLTGEDVKTYAKVGISTDHECFNISEAREKILSGIKILIREGSAAKNFDTLIPILLENPEMVMFCSDDKHPDDLVKGHINQLVKRAIKKGFPFFDIIKACTLNPAKHYQLESGLLQKGDNADFILVDNLEDFNIISTYISGEKVAENGFSKLPSIQEEPINAFKASKINLPDICVKAKSPVIKVQKAFDGQLITDVIVAEVKIENGNIVCDTRNDILKLLVMNRYYPSKPAIGFINNFGLKKGAFASTVAHDSHNIIAVGACDEDIIKAVNILIDHKGGISVVNGREEIILPLPFAGIMSGEDGYSIAIKYELIDKKIKEFGSKLSSPVMTLSFMALLVIPSLKLSDKGLFDGNIFSLTEMFV